MSLHAVDRRGDPRTDLPGIVRQKSLIVGKRMTLASGRVSPFYFDMKPTLFDPEGANLIAESILALLAEEEVDFVGGLEMGAVPIVACVAQKSFPHRPIPGFFVRKEVKDHGTRRRIEGLPREAELVGKHVVMVDDVTTTGGSVLDAVEVVREAGGLVSRVVTVVDRLEGATENLAGHGIALTALLTADDFAIA